MPTRSLDPEIIREIVDAVARSLEAVPRSLEQQLSAVEVPLPPPATPAELPTAVRSLREATAQVDLLRRLLAAAADRGTRAALFVNRDGRLVGWEGTGFDDEPELSADLSTRALPADAPAVTRIFERQLPIACAVDGDVPVPDFGQTQRAEAWLYPLRVGERLAAVLYVDAAGDRVPDLEGIAVLVETAGLVVERLAAARAARPAPSGPTVSQPVAAHREQAAGTTGAVPSRVDQAGTAGAASEHPGEEPPATEPPATDSSAETPVAEESRESAGPSSPPGGDDELEAVEVALELEDEPRAGEGTPAADEGEEAHAPGAELGEPGGEEARADETGEDTGAAFEIMTPEELGAAEPDDGVEQDARRFARLLMQEIVLYHRDAVEKGRSARDLLARLAEPIANARRLYEQRVPPDRPARMAWFEEEMIRVLAEGDPDLLGQREQQEA